MSRGSKPLLALRLVGADGPSLFGVFRGHCASAFANNLADRPFDSVLTGSARHARRIQDFAWFPCWRGVAVVRVPRLDTTITTVDDQCDRISLGKCTGGFNSLALSAVEELARVLPSLRITQPSV